MEQISSPLDRPKISVVIRNRNEGEHLRQVLRALHAQVLQEYEVVVVDNDSTDESLIIARTAGARTIKLDEFTYGRGLNVGISEAKADIIVILSAHSIPIGRYFLTECLEFMRDPIVAAARLVYAGKGSDMDRWAEPELLTSEDEDFISKGPLASGCVIRRSVWESIAFDEAIPAAEDKIWAVTALRRGYKIVSPAPAFYYYSKSLTRTQELYKNYKELEAVRDRLGSVIGFVNTTTLRAVRRFFVGIASIVINAARQVRYEAAKAYLTLTFPKR